jgi:hypothetical protein
MAPRRKKKEQEPAADQGDAYEPVPGEIVNVDFPPAEEEAIPGQARQEPTAGGEQRRADLADRLPPRQDDLRATITEPFEEHRDGRVVTGTLRYIDELNAGGVGHKISYDDPTERPTEEQKAVLKEPGGSQGQYPGPRFRKDRKDWHQPIGTDADPKRAVAIRLGEEARHDRLHGQLDHRARLEQERKEQQGNGPIPD